MSITQDDAERLLLGHLPPGAEKLYDLRSGSDVRSYFDAIAEALRTYGYDAVEVLRSARTALTAPLATLAKWERSFGVALGKIAQYGDTDQRRAQVVSRLRESGSFTPDNIRAVVAPLLGYADPATLEILEPDHADIVSQLSYAKSTGFSFNSSTESQSVIVADQGVVSAAGAVLTITTFEYSDETDIVVTLTAPDGESMTWENDRAVLPIGGGSYLLHFFAPSLAGVTIGGEWILTLASASNSVACDHWSLRVEGIGRDGVTEGLGAAHYKWAVVVDPALVGVANAADYTATRQALVRLKPAHTMAYLVKRMSGGGICAIFDEAAAAFDGCTFC